MDVPPNAGRSEALAALTLGETRVLGVLVEKQRTVPDTYPLTLNALVAGCNQKTSRDPILELAESDVQSALDALKTRSLIVESSGSRVMRYAHNVERVLGVPSQAVAILAVLMLRGPQTAGELRINCDRLHHFADISAVEGFLHELATRPAGALVVELPRTPGTRETRWAQLLSGPYEGTATAGVASSRMMANDTLALEEALAALRADIDALKATVAALCEKLGVPPPSVDR
jgi:uncharacterized protein YceH (UPF0502 family)